jgi:hypothetical protein
MLLTERGELVRAARVAYGPMPPPAAKEKIRKWAVGHLEALASVLRITLDIPAEVEQVLAALYGDGQAAIDPTAAGGSGLPSAPAGSAGAVMSLARACPNGIILKMR